MIHRATLIPLVLFALCSCGGRTQLADSGTASAEPDETETIIDGLRQGQYVRYYPSGKVEMSCNYHDGKLDGPIIFYFENNGRIFRSATYKEGVLVGTETVYYPDGNIKSMLVHGTGPKYESISSYYNSGMPFMEMKHPEGKPYTTMIFHYGNGNISEIVNTMNMKPIGEYVAYYEDGSLKKTGHYLDGRLSGKWSFYNRNGIIEKTIDYE